MSAIIKACNVTNTPKNTGKQCDTAMVATAMLIAVQRGLEFTLTNLLDPVGWLTTLIHEKKAFPLFGQTAPIREITNNKEADIIVTLDDGLQVFLRYGIYNRVFGTTSGGLCYAEALASFLNSGYDIIEIDQIGQMLARKNSNGTYSPLITDFMQSPSPTLADFKNTPYKNHFGYSFTPIELINNGIIFKGAEALLSMTGLLDTVITQGTTAASTTKLYLGVKTACAETNLVASSIGTDLADDANFEVTLIEDGTHPTVTAAAIVSGQIELTGTFVSGKIYRVTGTAATVWLANDVEGYDGTTSYVDITIP